MESWWSSPWQGRPLDGTGDARFWAERWQTPAGVLEIALLRQCDPDRLFLAGTRCLARGAWERHCAQGRDFVLVASRPLGRVHEVLGTLELHREERPDGHGPRWLMLDRLYVLPHQRQRRIGTRLVRAAIAFARGNGFAGLRETIPNILAYDDAVAGWRPLVPTGETFGGLRSLGATLNACAAEGLSCRVVAATRRQGHLPARAGQRTASIGALLELPINTASAEMGRGIPSSSAREMLEPVLHALARCAGVALAGEARVAA